MITKIVFNEEISCMYGSFIIHCDKDTTVHASRILEFKGQLRFVKDGEGGEYRMLLSDVLYIEILKYKVIKFPR